MEFDLRKQIIIIFGELGALIVLKLIVILRKVIRMLSLELSIMRLDKILLDCKYFKVFWRD